MARPSSAAYGMARYGAVVALKLMMRPSTRPPTMPTRMEVPTTEASPVDMYCDHGHSAPASSTTRSRNDLLIAPCSVMRSPRAIGRGWPEKVFSFNPGLPDRDTGRGIDISLRSQADSIFDLLRPCGFAPSYAATFCHSLALRRADFVRMLR